MADIIDLIYADHDWLRLQFFRLGDAKSKEELAAVETTPEILKAIEDETEDVIQARKENGEHLYEEEREAMPDFIKSASLELRQELGMQWLRFYAEHEASEGIDSRDKDADDYIDLNS